MTPFIYPDFSFAQFSDFCTEKINEDKNNEIFSDYHSLKITFMQLFHKNMAPTGHYTITSTLFP